MYNYFDLFFNAPVIISGLVSLSGAISTIYFSGSFNILNVLFFGSSSFIINFLLYYPDIRDMDLYKAFENFDFVTFLKLSLSVLAGLLTAIVVFNSTLEVIGAVLFGLTPVAAIAQPPLLLLLIGGGLTMASFIANTALYLNSFNLNNISYFFDTAKSSLIIWQRLIDNTNGLLDGFYNLDIMNIISNAFKVLADLFVIAASLVLATSIYLLSWGIFKTQVSKVSVDFFKITNIIYQNIINSIVCVGQLLNGLFYVDKILKPVNSLALYLFGGFLNIENSDCKDEKNSETENKDVTLSQKGLVVIMLICSCSNAAASGKGFMNDPESISFIDSLFNYSFAESNLTLYAFVLGAMSSFIANFEKSSEAVLEPQKNFAQKC